jgi:mono/diheme cytochrome c family protein
VTIVRPLVVAACVLAASAAFGSDPGAAQPTGAFTSAQAATGAKIFATQCVACHGAKLEGGAGPQLAGDDFMAKWSGQTAADIYDIVSTQMPLTNPGSLKPAEALALVAYILQQNKYVAGDTALDAARLKTVKIAKP